MCTGASRVQPEVGAGQLAGELTPLLWAYHRDAERFRQERQRQNEPVLAGRTIPRFTWDDLTHRPTAVLTKIQTALEA